MLVMGNNLFSRACVEEANFCVRMVKQMRLEYGNPYYMWV